MSIFSSKINNNDNKKKINFVTFVAFFNSAVLAHLSKFFPLPPKQIMNKIMLIEIIKRETLGFISRISGVICWNGSFLSNVALICFYPPLFVFSLFVDNCVFLSSPEDQKAVLEQLLCLKVPGTNPLSPKEKYEASHFQTKSYFHFEF